jgi:hypothetical protein
MTTMINPSKAPRAVRRSNAAAAASAAVAAAASLELAITQSLHASGALFNIEPERRKDNGPIMSGTLRADSGVAVPVSLFREQAEDTGLIYASLAIGGKAKTKFYGKLFHTENEPGSGPMYSGFIVVLPVDRPEQHSAEAWANAPGLQVCGWRRRSADGKARISLSIAPRSVDQKELAF